MILLKEIQKVMEELGYACVHHEQTDELPIAMLIIEVSEDDDDLDDIDMRYLTVSIIPEGGDLDGSEFIQFFYTNPTPIESAGLEELKNSLISKNRNLPLGHYNFTEGELNVYFKYVLVLPKNKPIETAFLNDVLDMCVYAVKGL